MDDLKPGDLLMCIDTDSFLDINIGNIYTFTRYHRLRGGLAVFVENGTGSYKLRRFKKLLDYPFEDCNNGVI